MNQYPTGTSLGRTDVGRFSFYPYEQTELILNSDQFFHSLHRLATLTATLGQPRGHLEDRNKWQVLGTAYASTATERNV